MYQVQYGDARKDADTEAATVSSFDSLQSTPASSLTVSNSSNDDASSASSESGEQNVLVAMRERLDEDYDPMIIFGLGKFSEAEIAAYNQLHVIPFNPEAKQHCRQVVSEYAVGGFGTNCTTEREHPPHPYEALDSEELSELAEHDAAAAIIFGKRVRDVNQKLNLHLRAAALSGKPGPLLYLAETRYASFTISTPKEGGGYTKKHYSEKLIRRLSLEMIASKLKDPRANPNQWRKNLINSHFIDDAAKAIEASEALTLEWLAQMSDIQRRITGGTQMHELINQTSQLADAEAFSGKNL